MRFFARFAMAAVLGAAVLAFSQTQSAVSVWDGVYSADQAKRGADVYAKSCAMCHGDELEGEGQAPPLAGSEFTSAWNNQTVDDVFEIVKSTMPADKPGSLTRAQNADLFAFIFQKNRFPAGKAELPQDAAALKKITIEEKKK
jgi:mono/diheme cytochrome c family protein